MTFIIGNVWSSLSWLLTALEYITLSTAKAPDTSWEQQTPAIFKAFS